MYLQSRQKFLYILSYDVIDGRYQGFRLNLGKSRKMLFLSHFWPLLSWATIFGWLGVNFIKVFTLSFYARRSQKCKKLLNLCVFFSLLRSWHVKAACKHIYEIDTWSLPGICSRIKPNYCSIKLVQISDKHCRIAERHFLSKPLFRVYCSNEKKVIKSCQVVKRLFYFSFLLFFCPQNNLLSSLSNNKVEP